MSAATSDLKPLLRPVLEAAADWHVRLRFDTDGARAETEAAHARWLAASEQHQRAWTLVQQMDQQLGLLPQRASTAALNSARQQRRAVLKGLLVLAGGGLLGGTAYEHTPWRGEIADYRTATGERRRVALPDGGHVDLNTATALDVQYDAGQRLLRLHAGEMLVETAADRLAAPRPFIVATPHGRIRALGTRFGVRLDADRSRVAVYEHAVEITPRAGGSQLRLAAGEATGFTATAIAPVQSADPNGSTWTRGMLMAVDQRLDDFLDELSRYRHGRIDCDPAVAGLRVTGAYRIDDIDHVLDSLTLSHPVRIRHFTRFWTRIAARLT